jgi:outer membrane receptor protein involved in Fe transport
MRAMNKTLLQKSTLCCAIALCTATTDAAVLEEVVVTATKRAESIQDVPVSVAAVSAERMDKMGISDMEDLSIVIPNFEINSAAIMPNLYIRGLGGGLAHSIEQSVGRFVDDVYISRAAINFHPFMDVAGVEVLRGPQGTLFGKNTLAGAMIMRTGDPTDEFEAGIDLSVGDYSTTGGNKEVSGFVSGPLSESVNARLAFMWKDKDGFYENTMEGPDGADREDKGIRVKFDWAVSDSTTVGLKLEHMEYDEDGSDTAETNAFAGGDAGWQGLAANAGAANPELVSANLDWVIHVDCSDANAAPGPQAGQSIGAFCPFRDQESDNITLDIEHDIEGGTIKLISAYQTYDYTHGFHGADMGAVNMFRAIRAEEFSGFSQEIRFTSEPNDSFDYIVGLYYEDSNIERDQTSHLNLPGGPFMTEEEPWEQDTETLAVFGQFRWSFADSWTAIVGGRWATEDKEFTFDRWYNEYQTNNFLFSEVVGKNEDRTEKKFTPSFTLQWDVNEDINLFANLSRGHKTGGFSDRVDEQETDIEFDAEVVDSFELGAKTYWLDGALSMNLTYYYMEIEGLQLSTQIEGTVANFKVDNAADTTSTGLEFELNWALNDNWLVGGNYSYTDATYDEFVGAGDCPEKYENAEGVCDLGGLPLQYAPENKGSLFLEYSADSVLNGWSFSARGDISFTDDQYTDISYFDTVMQEAYETVNASVRLISPDENYTVSLIGKNLTEEEIMAWGVPSGPNILAAMSAPRELILKLAMRF